MLDAHLDVRQTDRATSGTPFSSTGAAMRRAQAARFGMPVFGVSRATLQALWREARNWRNVTVVRRIWTAI